MNFLAVFLGGGLGALLRYVISIICIDNLKVNLPVSTFIVNIMGCFVLGILYVFFLEKAHSPQYLKPMLNVGFCGGLTTFSTFSLEMFVFLEHNQILQAITYALLSIILGVLAVILGGILCRNFIV